MARLVVIGSDIYLSSVMEGQMAVTLTLCFVTTRWCITVSTVSWRHINLEQDDAKALVHMPVSFTVIGSCELGGKLK